MMLSAPTTRSHVRMAFLLGAAMAVTVGIALGFQHIGGYIPCKLCYEQRIPYYIGVPVMVLALLSAWANLPGIVTRVLFLIGGALMVWGLYLGIYHSGVEWGWWPGPTDCAVAVPPPDTGGQGVLEAIDAYTPPSCDRAALRVLGLSFAGWNVIASLVLAVAALRAAFSRG